MKVFTTSLQDQTQEPTVVLLSGGLDSAANLALAVGRRPVKLAVTIHYGQRAAAREIYAARSLCDYYEVDHQVVEIPFLGALGGSSLTDSQVAMPALKTSELDDPTITRASAGSVWVPNRNGVLIEVAASVAERLGAGEVLVGFNREEAATFPDNTLDYLKALNGAFQYSTQGRVAVGSITVGLNKTEIAQELARLEKPFPWDLVWSCYFGEAKPCGGCESCRRLARARGAVL